MRSPAKVALAWGVWLVASPRRALRVSALLGLAEHRQLKPWAPA
jgi:hypothetical protein